MTKIVIIDAQIAGISGDMLLSSLVDIGANKKKVIDSIFACQDYFDGTIIRKAEFLKSVSHGISCTKFLFDYKDSTHSRAASTVYKAISACSDSLDLSDVAKSFVLNSLKRIIVAESKIHGTSHNSVRLHEVSTIDTAADLIGTAVALDNLNLFSTKFYSTDVAVGNGLLEFSHGVVPNPGNAILEILSGSGILLVPGKIDGELTTPTGASMLVNLESEHVSQYPPFMPVKVGNGGGQKDDKNVANILRVIIGNSSSKIDYPLETIYELETNVDDATGEVIGNLIDVLYENSAKDVTVLQGISKKSRPSFVIKVLSDKESKDALIQILLSETGSLGCRVNQINRIILPRSIVTLPLSIQNRKFEVKVKISKNTKGVINSMKPESDDIRKISRTLKTSYKKIFDIVRQELTKKYK